MSDKKIVIICGVSLESVKEYGCNAAASYLYVLLKYLLSYFNVTLRSK